MEGRVWVLLERLRGLGLGARSQCWMWLSCNVGKCEDIENREETRDQKRPLFHRKNFKVS